MVSVSNCVSEWLVTPLHDGKSNEQVEGMKQKRERKIGRKWEGGRN